MIAYISPPVCNEVFPNPLIPTVFTHLRLFATACVVEDIEHFPVFHVYRHGNFGIQPSAIEEVIDHNVLYADKKSNSMLHSTATTFLSRGYQSTGAHSEHGLCPGPSPHEHGCENTLELTIWNDVGMVSVSRTDRCSWSNGRVGSQRLGLPRAMYRLAVSMCLSVHM